MSIAVLDGEVKLGGLDACRFHYNELKKTDGAIIAAVKAVCRSMMRVVTLPDHEICQYMAKAPHSVVTKKIENWDISFPLPFPLSQEAYDRFSCHSYSPSQAATNLSNFLADFCEMMGLGNYNIDELQDGIINLYELIQQVRSEANKMEDQWCRYETSEDGSPQAQAGYSSEDSKFDKDKDFNVKAVRHLILTQLEQQLHELLEAFCKKRSALKASIHST